jgi:hypothetical protein
MAETFAPPLSALGWRGKFKSDSTEVEVLRRRLQTHAGIDGAEGQIVDPAARYPEGFAARAAAQFHRDGYVVVAKCLDEQRLTNIKSGCENVIREMVALDPLSAGSRGSHRYTFGSAPAHFGQQAAWAALIDPPVTLAVVQAIFGDGYWTASSTSGGDFVLPGCVDYQHLHADGQMDPTTGEHARDWRLAPNHGGYHDSSGSTHFRDLPCPMLTVNYPMELAPGSVTGHSRINGATRQIPGTHRSRALIPSLEEEPLWMKMSTVAPCPAGCGLFRDLRCWHGGTPNLSEHVRAIPSAGSYLAPWYRPPGRVQRTLPYEIYTALSPAGQVRHAVR